MTPMQALRKHCLWCCLDQFNEVRECISFNCALHPFRSGRIPQDKPQSPLKAIRARCMDRCCQNDAEVNRCKSDCTLLPFRMGHSPNYSEETKERMRQRAKLAGFGLKDRPTSQLDD